MLAEYQRQPRLKERVGQTHDAEIVELLPHSQRALVDEVLVPSRGAVDSCGAVVRGRCLSQLNAMVTLEQQPKYAYNCVLPSAGLTPAGCEMQHGVSKIRDHFTRDVLRSVLHLGSRGSEEQVVVRP